MQDCHNKTDSSSGMEISPPPFLLPSPSPFLLSSSPSLLLSFPPPLLPSSFPPSPFPPPPLPGDYRVEVCAVPEVGEGEVLVKTLAVGICAGDAKCYAGAPYFWGEQHCPVETMATGN